MMLGRRSVLAAGVAAWSLPVGPAASQSVPSGYPADYANLIAAAQREGRVSVYTSTDSAQGQSLVNAFRAAYPGITVDWNDLGTNGTFNRVISEAAANQMGADLVWTSAMDQLLSLVDRNLTQTYRSPEAAKLPTWAVYKDQAFGTSVEPACVLYNKNQLSDDAVPRTHAALLALLRDRRDALRNKVGTFDPEKSGTGFLFHTATQRNVPQFWDIVRAFGAASGKVYSSSGQMREKAVSGEHSLLFSVIGSYALEWAKANPVLGVAFLTDYVPAFSRVALIPRGAPHPNGGKLLLDFMLSKVGQEALGNAGVPSIRTDVAGEMSLDGIRHRVGGNLQPLPVDETTAANLETQRRVEFLQHWRRALRG